MCQTRPVTGPQPRLFVLRAGGRAAEGLRTSIVVPAYNEAERLPRLLAGLAKTDTGADDRTEIIIVDDGSTDETVPAAERAGSWSPNLRVIGHPTNRGKGAAVRTGVMAARGDIVAFLDADNATDLAALGPMCTAIAGQVGAVFGSRHAPGATVHGSPPIRGVMGRVFNHVVRIAAGTSISDTQCGAKVFWAPAARVVFAASEIDGFAFDVDVLRRLMALGVGVVEYPVDWHYVAGTKIGPLTPLSMLRDIAVIRARTHRLERSGVDCLDSPELRAIADPIVPRDDLVDGQRCRVVPVAPESERAVADALCEAGVTVIDQART